MGHVLSVAEPEALVEGNNRIHGTNSGTINKTEQPKICLRRKLLEIQNIQDWLAVADLVRSGAKS